MDRLNRSSKEAIGTVRSNAVEMARMLQGNSPDQVRTMIPARITASALISSASYRWAYSWVECWWDAAGTSPDNFSDRSGGLDSTNCGSAYNLAEADNTATDVGPEYVVAEIPVGFEPVACEGHVMLFAHRSAAGAVVWFFHKSTPISGACE